jgi:hypothetical protein
MFCIEFIDDGPDDMGRRTFFLYWKTDYTPSIPKPHIRAQIFHAKPEDVLNRRG